VAIDALRIIAVVASLAWRLLRDNTQRLQLLLGEVVMVAVWALVLTTGNVMAAPATNVMLVAAFELLDTLDFVSIVVAWNIYALPCTVALH
jgi:hypothetical protein